MTSLADYDQAIDYVERALAIAERHEQLDLAANLQFNIGGTHHFAGRTAEACAAFDRSLEAGQRAQRKQPERGMNLPPGVGSFEEMIAGAKAEAGCP